MARRWKVLIVTSVAVFMALLDVTIVNIAFPDIRRTFATEPLSNLSWILNAYNVVFAAALVPAGRLADRFGRRRFFLAGIAVFLVASLVCALAGSVGVLVGARIVQALGAAVLMPTSLSLVLPEFPLEKRATATALWTATGAVAAATGPSLGGLLVDWQGWRWVFLVNLIIGLPALVPAVRLLRESRDERATGWPDLPGAAILAVGVAALALSLVKGEDWGWGSGRVLGGFGLAAVLLAVFLVRSRRVPAPVIDLALFRIRSFSAASAGAFLFSIGFYAQLLNGVLFLTGVWGYSALGAGFALTPGPIAAALCAPVAGRLADRFGQRVIAVPGGLLFGAGALLLSLGTGPGHDYATVYLPGIVLAGAGVGFVLPAFGSAAVAELPPARFATGIAISSCGRQLGAVVGIAGLIAVLRSQPVPLDGAHRAWTLIALTGLAAALAGVSLGRVHPRPAPQLLDTAAFLGASPQTPVEAQPPHPPR
jgi:EmrB/QacA subfamily drug resistance transporter